MGGVGWEGVGWLRATHEQHVRQVDVLYKHRRSTCMQNDRDLCCCNNSGISHGLTNIQSGAPLRGAPLCVCSNGEICKNCCSIDLCRACMCCVYACTAHLLVAHAAHVLQEHACCQLFCCMARRACMRAIASIFARCFCKVKGFEKWLAGGSRLAVVKLLDGMAELRSTP